MNEQERKIGEAIIQLHKDNDGSIDETFMDYADHFKLSYATWIGPVLDELKRRDLIYQFNDYTTRLTDKGKKFKSFADEDFKAEKAEEIEAMNFESLQLQLNQLRNKMFDYERNNARAKRNEIWVILSLILAAISIVLSLRK